MAFRCGSSEIRDEKGLTFNHISSVRQTISSPRMSMPMQSPRWAMRITAPSVLISGWPCLFAEGCGLNREVSTDFGRADGCSRIATSAVDEPSRKGTRAPAADPSDSADSDNGRDGDNDADVGARSGMLSEGDGERELPEELASSGRQTCDCSVFW